MTRTDHTARTLNDDMLDAVVGAGDIISSNDAPAEEATSTTGTGKFKIKRTHTSGG